MKEGRYKQGKEQILIEEVRLEGNKFFILETEQIAANTGLHVSVVASSDQSPFTL